MINNNSKRLFVLLNILKRETDEAHPLKTTELISKLNNEGIKVNNRKTLYNDFEVLKEAGFEVEYKNGYYLVDAPFTMSEIKIIVDSLNSLKNLDDVFLNKLNRKLYSYISIYDEKQLKSLEYHNSHLDKKFINRLEDSLYAIENHFSLKLDSTNGKSDEIFPLFIHRDNDYYYLYYHYVNNDKIYHTRFDRISSLKILNNLDKINISKSTIIKNINASSNSYITGKTSIVNIEILKNKDFVIQKMNDDFKDIIVTNKGVSISINPNIIFYSKLCEYGDNIKIVSPTDIKKEFKKYLKDILNNY